jgi:TetR/AcrR family tetracycline transcriptional repressor
MMRVKRAQRPQITEESIITAAWALLGSMGIEEFSMRKLADELNIQAPSLYWYFKNKQSIFQALANEVAKEALVSATLEGPWQIQLTHFATCIKNTFNKYPCSAQLWMRTVPMDPDYLTVINTLLRIIDPLPIEERDKFASAACLLNYVISFELDKYEQRKVDLSMVGEGQEGPQILFRQSLEQLSEEKTQVIKRMYDNGLFKELGSDHMFDTGLRLIVSGIERLAHEG